MLDDILDCSYKVRSSLYVNRAENGETSDKFNGWAKFNGCKGRAIEFNEKSLRSKIVHVQDVPNSKHRLYT